MLDQTSRLKFSSVTLNKTLYSSFIPELWRRDKEGSRSGIIYGKFLEIILMSRSVEEETDPSTVVYEVERV